MKKKRLDKSERPYILDEIFKRSNFVYLGSYFAGMIFFFAIFSPPSWLIVIILSGFGMLGQALIGDKFIHANWLKPPQDDPEPENSLIEKNAADGENDGPGKI